jgi:hypothetical protein
VAQERIVVDFKEPEAEIFVNKKVVAQELKAKFALLLIELGLDGLDGINDDVSHFWKHVFLDRHVEVGELIIQELLEERKGDCIPFLMQAEGSLVLHLQAVVSQMHI